jgi:cephalosporin hydroxylase/glycosyltransferase involved in cell wall biosynthesis
MFPFYDDVIAPILRASGAQRILEIGIRQGATTAQLLEQLAPGAELHAIDPVPDFDAAALARAFPGRYLVHADTSHKVLPGLPPFDVALIDGDHNWFTVYHELRMLAETSRRAGVELPVCILHDVGWPYGRRDLYYEPSRIPSEFRHEYAQRGLHPSRKGFVSGSGGLNASMYNAVDEGGPRNGVMTAVDDFVHEYDEPLRTIVLPIYFGLAILVTEARIVANPELAQVLDWLESASGRARLLELSESIRLRGLANQRTATMRAEDRFETAAAKYLDLLKGALLDEHYIENEVRLQYLAECLAQQRTFDENALRDPVRRLKPLTAKLETRRRTGALHATGRDAPSFLPYSDMGRARLDHLEATLDRLRSAGITGDLVECGTGRGGGAIFMRGYLDIHGIGDRTVWVSDTFRVERDLGAGLLDLSTDLNLVRDAFGRFGLLDDRVRFLQGPYAETLADAPLHDIALLRIGFGLGASAGEILEALHHKVVAGGHVIVEDYADAACAQAVDAFRSTRGITAPLERTDWSTVAWSKDTPAADRGATQPSSEAQPMQQSALATTTKDLSVIVVFFNMRREAARTLHSLTRAYQRDIAELDYEVIVVENGSADEAKLGAEFVESFGPEFCYVDLDTDATPSPAIALNRGLARATGDALAFMIDGAHVLTPGVLRHGMAGLATYPPALVLTQQWYVGPGQQGDEMRNGYDRAYEDRLFERIGWPTDGYRLFEIGHFIGDRDWFGGLWESNCVFVSRKLLEHAGGFDEAFDLPGGGYANLDFYERIGCTPGVKVVTILGEGSFHQLHGGDTTNELDPGARRQRIVSYAEHYRDLRGREFQGPRKTLHYVGSMIPAALRTHARRMTASAFRDAREAVPRDQRPTRPSPMPDELATDFIDAYWHTLAWQDTEWLGRCVPIPATDLVAYQTIITRVRPDWVVETGTGNGGRAWFLASVCDLVGRGRVVSLAAELSDELPRHDRIVYRAGNAEDPDIGAWLDELVGDEPNGLVILGSCRGERAMVDEFAALHRFVPVGSYVVMEHTIVGGHPVLPGFGPGPREAVKAIIAKWTSFVIDTRMNKDGLTFNRSGFLQRVR